MTAARNVTLSGFVFALTSAASFGLSGIFASALISAGWTPGAAVTLRITLSAVVLLIPTLILLRGEWGKVRRAWKDVLLFGLLAVAGCQLAFFMAVEYIPPSLAILIEFMGPVLLIFWFWARTRMRPATLTLLGALVAIIGLVAVSGLATGGTSLHPLGIMFALIAAVGLAVYFATSAETTHGIAPLPFVGLGLGLGAIVLIITSALGILPFKVAAADVTLLGNKFSPWVAVAGMVLVSTVFAYILGVGAARRLGATVASFTGYSEPLFAIIWTILFLAIAPTGMQWIGAALIIAGVVLVKIGELGKAKLQRS